MHQILLKMTGRYRYERLASDRLRKGAGSALFVFVAWASAGPVGAETDFQLHSEDVVAILGGTNAVRAQQSGSWETALTVKFSAARPKFRDLAWEADTVHWQGTIQERWREETWGEWNEQLDRVGATVVIAQYGQLEALDGAAKLSDFVTAYRRLLTEFQRPPAKILLVSPTPFEKSDDLLPDLSERNAELAQYVAAIRGLARERGHAFVDLFTPLVDRFGDADRATTNGMHVAPGFQRLVASEFARQIGMDQLDWERMASLEQAVVTKHALWVERWRPANWKCLWGDDGERRFGMAIAGGLSLRDEMKAYPRLIGEAEARVWRLAAAVQ